MKLSRPLLLVVLVAIAAVATVLGAVIGLGGVCESPFTRMRVIRAEFSQLPADDLALKAWLLESPGMATAYVQRSGNAIEIVLIVRASAPDFAELPAELQRLGYKGVKSYEPNYREPAP